MPHEESSITLTLPGDFPGLLRKCSPAILDGLSVTITDTPTSEWAIGAGATSDDSGPPWAECRLASFALDLTEQTGRTHAAWWLAEQHTGLPWPSGVLFALDMFDGCQLVLAKNSSVVGFWAEVVSHLDPSDPRLLPDGSRWVDAEALRLVCLHVAAEVTS